MPTDKAAKLTGIVFAAAATILPLASWAAFETGLNETANVAGYQTGAKADLIGIISLVVKGLLGFLGVVFVLLMIYAGFLWMTAQGNDDKVKDARNIILDATIGLVIILSAYAITDQVLRLVLESTGIQ